MADCASSRKDRISAKKRQREKDYIKAKLKAKRLKEFEFVRSEVKGAYVFQIERNVENLNKKYWKYIPSNHVCINHNMSVVQGKTSKEVVLVARCLPFKDMSKDEFMEYEKITLTLLFMMKGASNVTTNTAKKSGKMYAVGWRGGTNSGLTVGRYVPDGSIQRNELELRRWEQQQKLLFELARIYGKKFSTLAPTLFEHTRLEAVQTRVPTLAETKFDLLHVQDNAFCSNLTYTIKDFSNCFHKDNDFNAYSFGIWAPICLETGKLLGRQNGFSSTGGQFLLGSYKAYVDFNLCDGIVEIIWRGKTDFHSTLPGTTSENCTRFGSSVQISKSLVERVKTLCKMNAKGDDISKKVHGVNKIMETKLKDLN